MSMLLNFNPSVFYRSAELKEEGCPGPFTSEDLHRAFRVRVLGFTRNIRGAVCLVVTSISWSCRSYEAESRIEVRQVSTGSAKT